MAAMATLTRSPHLASAVLTSTGTALCLPPSLPRTLHPPFKPPPHRPLDSSALQPPKRLEGGQKKKKKKAQREFKSDELRVSGEKSLTVGSPLLLTASLRRRSRTTALTHPVSENQKKNPVVSHCQRAEGAGTVGGLNLSVL